VNETLDRAQRRVARRLALAGIIEAQLEARRLVGWAAQLAPAGLICARNDCLDDQAVRRLEAALDHRLSRRPLAHLEGWTEFYGLRLKTDARALIPRSDSECVVDLALDCLKAGAPARIADLGTGSACLLLAVLSKRPLASGIGIDASAAAISLARENAVSCGLDARALFSSVDWADWDGWSECDLVICNPPYIAAAEIAGLAPEVRDHEPTLALNGGQDGLEAYREIISLGARHMACGAPLVLEIGHTQRESVAELLTSEGFDSLAFRTDLEGRDRAIAGFKP
jgi:release factor glutamine methyltransferase